MKVTQQILKNSLDKTLAFHKVDETEKGNNLRIEVLSTLTKEFTEWCSEGRLLPIGSYKLGVHSPDSDIDIVCVAPSHYTREEFQQEFFKRLQLIPGVSYCYGVFRAKVPIIKLIMRGIKIDVQYANTDQDINDLSPESLDDASVLSLNAYRNNEMLLALVPNVEKFKFLLKTIRLWAKKRGIYSGILGFLGGAAWSILCAKICILYPNLSEVELVHKFFKVFSLWDWSIPICLNPDQSSFTYNSHQALMILLTPAYPSYNTAYTLTTSSFYCIISEIELGYKITKDILEGNQEWQALFEEIDFFQQYRYLIKVCIHASTDSEFETWSGIVFSRIKYLLQELECIYPRPIVIMYNKPFESHQKNFKVSYTYYIGLNFNCSQNIKVDLRIPINNFCNTLNELRPNKATMSLRIAFMPRKEVCNTVFKQINKS